MSITVPFFDLKAQNAELREEIREAIARVIDSGTFILGREVAEFEREAADYIGGIGHAVGVSSGTDGLVASLMALDIGPGDEVITAPFTFVATAGAIARVGARPVFADIDPETFNIDPDKIEAAVTARTKAIIPVHLFGLLADMARIASIAKRHNLAVIEDACQAIGYNGIMGRAAVYSFFPSKNLGGMGDGGLVVTDDALLDGRLRAIRHHGSVGPYRHIRLGGNFRLDELQAAILRVKLPHLGEWETKRRVNACYYNERIRALGLDVIPPVPSGVCNQYTVRVKDRGGVKAALEEMGVGTAVYYPMPLHLQPCFEYLGYKAGDFPEAERASREVLSLPIYPELPPASREYVIQCLTTALSR